MQGHFRDQSLVCSSAFEAFVGPVTEYWEYLWTKGMLPGISVPNSLVCVFVLIAIGRDTAHFGHDSSPGL
jgi:hypothetical protein